MNEKHETYLCVNQMYSRVNEKIFFTKSNSEKV